MLTVQLGKLAGRINQAQRVLDFPHALPSSQNMLSSLRYLARIVSTGSIGTVQEPCGDEIGRGSFASKTNILTLEGTNLANIVVRKKNYNALPASRQTKPPWS